MPVAQLSPARAAFDHMRGRAAGPRALAFLVARLAPVEVDDVETEFWERLLSRLPAGLPPEVDRGARAFLLAVGLRRGDEGRKLVLRCLTPVHKALARAELEASRWAVLEKQLPDLGLWRNWDKGESLRRGIVERALEHQWPAAELLGALRDKQLWSQMLDTCAASDGGRRLLDRLRRAVKQRPAVALPFQRQDLRRKLLAA